MGNYKFRFSDMIPNAWFYKLKYMSSGRTRNHSKDKLRHHQHHHPTTTSSSSPSSVSIGAAGVPAPAPHRLSGHRKSYHLPNRKASDTHFPDEPPRRSSKKRRSAADRTRNRASGAGEGGGGGSRILLSSTVPVACSCRATLEPVWTSDECLDSSAGASSRELDRPQPELRSDRALKPDTFDGMVSLSASCHDNPKAGVVEVESFSELGLPPIRTNPEKETKDGNVNESGKQRRTTSASNARNETANRGRKPSAKSPGLKLRTNSPRIVGGRKVQGNGGRKSVSGQRRRSGVTESFAVVKSSDDPQRDFMESMVEMIVENNIRASKDLEELLACYLQLNSNEYHELIIRVFKQIWFDIN